MDNLDQPAGDPAWRFRGFQTWPMSIEAQRDFLTIAASLAARSSHPCAKDLHRVALWNSQGTQEVTGFQDFGEKGFGGIVQLPGEPAPRTALIGTHKFLIESHQEIPETLISAAGSWEEEGAPVFYCAWDGTARAALRFGG
jgi:cation transport ATPase